MERPARPQTCIAYALDCLDHRYPWSTHELLEPLWRAQRGRPRGDALQAVIALASHRLLSHLQRPLAAARSADRARRLAEGAPAALEAFGLSREALLSALSSSDPWHPLPFASSRTGFGPGETSAST